MILNRSQSAISRAIKDGRLEYIDSERRLLHRPGLEQRFARKTRPRIDAPQRKTQMRLMQHESQPEPLSQGHWERLAEKLSFVLEGAPAYWAMEPDAYHLRVFCRTLDELRQQCEMEGLEP